jgi:hypothetical protein
MTINKPLDTLGSCSCTSPRSRWSRRPTAGSGRRSTRRWPRTCHCHPVRSPTGRHNPHHVSTSGRWNETV